MGVVFCVSLAFSTVLLLSADKFNFGFLAIFLGISVFYAYYGLARGFLASGRLAVVDIGNNILQVVLILVLLQFLDIQSTLLAMLIRGFAPIVPVILLQRFWPLPNAFDSKLVNLETVKTVLKFSLPVWVSHASYMLYATIAILFLEHYTDTTMVGIFSLATTLGIALSFFPSGLATLLMPKIAAKPDKQYRSLLGGALGLVLFSDFVLVALYYFLGPWLVGTVFGSSYLIFPEVFVLMAVVETFAGAHTILTTVYIGRGRTNEEMKSRLIAVLVTFISCWLLIPAYGVVGAVWAKMIGVICGLAVYGYVYVRDRMTLSYESR
jgi:O-antigen/teichoic acid export membrane protein